MLKGMLMVKSGEPSGFPLKASQLDRFAFSDDATKLISAPFKVFEKMLAAIVG